MKSATRRVRLNRQFTAIVQRDGNWFIAFCPEVAGANGQGRTRASCLKSLVQAIKLMVKINEEELAGHCGADAEWTLVTVA
ncbi:MAG: type II toxin-antitoxin system HicB family antitoxin [Verrucomicrobia bacterium]|nr:type II toxin-antitoxin system HicB family antitoxin [Verrucomicrobiota bacterium]